MTRMGEIKARLERHFYGNTRDDIDYLIERVERLEKECERLTWWLARIDGGDHPCRDEGQLRQWAYEAVSLQRPAELEG